MSPRRLLLAALALATVVSRAPAQENFHALGSAVRARQVLERAIAAHGGLTALQALNGVTRELRGVRTDIGQGSRPPAVAPSYDSIGADPPTGAPVATLSIRDYRKQRSVESNHYVIHGGQPVQVRTVATPTVGFAVYYDYIYHGVRPTSAAALPGRRLVATRRYPEGILLAAWSRPELTRWIGEGTYDGKAQRVIAFADADGALVTLYCDAQTNLLTKAETVTDHPILGDATVEVVFGDYRKVGNLTLPYRYVDKVGGYVLQDMRAQEIRLDAPLDDSLFARPDGFPDVDSPSPVPTVQKLAEDVFAIMGADYNSIAVGFRDYILVLEAGASSQYAQAAIAKIKEAIPGRPIRYLVTTHWNWDHLSGVRSYIAEGATIIATPMAKSVIERAARASHVLRPDTLSRSPRSPIIELMTDKKRVFSDGVHTVEIHDISPSPHVDEMLIAWLPGEKVLYEGDLLDINVPGMVGTGGDDTADFARKIEQLGFDVQQIVPVHGKVGTMEDLRMALSRRAAVAGAAR
jgi:glyoxylase-like metal-dependent hydrolase (beta-lactamase superfamily II)